MSSDSGQTTAVRTIGRYRAFDELGRGAMGVVYRGFDPVIGRTVALKTLLLDHTDPAAREFRDRLYREAAAAGALSHPNIVTIFDIIEDGNTTAVAMEFIEGRSLASIISERAPMAIDRAVDLFDQIASALDYAASHGIVHRDIKPANILITPAGRAKIADFGVARLALSTMTQAGTVLGSPSYMSPEQVRGLPLDGRSDLFSAAVVFYEMITLERPFAGNDVATTMYRIAHEPPTPPGQFNPGVGPAVTAVLDRALAKNPADRYQTGEALAAELRCAARLGPGDQAVPATSVGLSTLGMPVPTVVTPLQSAPLPSIGLPSIPLPAPGSESSGPKLALIPMSGAAPGVASGSGAALPALPALPPGAVAVPTVRTPVRPGGTSRTLVIVGVGAAAVLLVAIVVGVALMRSGTTDTPAGADVQAVAGIPALPPGDAGPVPAQPAPIAVAAPTPMAPPAAAATPPPFPPAQTSRPVSPRAATPAAPVGSKTGPRAEVASTQAAAPAQRDEPVRPAATSGGRVYTVTEVDEKPQVLRQVLPAYPSDAQQRRIEDIIVVNALVGTTGRVEDVTVIRKSAKSSSFDAAATAAIRQYQFSPAQKGGQAVRCWFSVGIPFQLPRQ